MIHCSAYGAHATAACSNREHVEKVKPVAIHVPTSGAAVSWYSRVLALFVPANQANALGPVAFGRAPVGALLKSLARRYPLLTSLCNDGIWELHCMRP